MKEMWRIFKQFSRMSMNNSYGPIQWLITLGVTFSCRIRDFVCMFMNRKLHNQPETVKSKFDFSDKKTSHDGLS